MPPVSKMFKLPNGEEIELFYIGTLASSLGRTPACIRKWEISGVIPDPLFKDNRHRRLYSQEQIDAIVHCAERAKIKQGSSISRTSFTKWCYQALDEIKERYLAKE